MVKVSPKTKKTTFQISLPEADSVTLVGDFNGWSDTATPMKKTRTGVWKADLKLDEGEYQFRYLVNENEWRNDEDAPAVPNIFGSENSVVSVVFPTPKKKAGTKKTSAKKTSSNGKK